jgi:hypothetical protein
MVSKSTIEIVVMFLIILAFGAIIILFLMNTAIGTNVFGKISLTSGIVTTLLTLLGIKKGFG